MTIDNQELKVVSGGKQAQDTGTSYSALLRDQKFELAEEREELTNVEIRKPRAKEYFQVSRDEPMEACILWENKKAWIVQPELALQARGQIVFCLLYKAITEDGEIFLLPTKDPTMHEDRTGDDSLRHAIKLAQGSWVRIEWGKKFKYRVFMPENTGLRGDPKWPPLSISGLIEIVKKERWINSPTNQLLRKAAEKEVPSDDV
jgi:hypothetical protein